MRTLLLLVVLAPALAHAQDAPPPEAPAAPPAPAPVAAPPTTPGDACRTRRHELEEQAAHTTDLQERARILQSLPDCAHPPAVLPPPPAETTTSAAPGFDVATGFAIELQVETGIVQTDNNSGLPCRRRRGCASGCRDRSSAPRLAFATTGSASTRAPVACHRP